MSTIRWGILGTGTIAKTFAEGVRKCKLGTLIAVGSRSAESVEKFGSAFNIQKRHASYESFLADPEIDAVYLSTPHAFHAEWAIKTLTAGKHLLCEKPMTLNHPEAMAVIECARTNQRFFMEAFMYRCHPQTQKLVELIRSHTIGEVRLIQAAFSFRTNFNPQGRLFSQELGGGGILDVGCYPTSMARLIAGAATGTPFAEPIEISGNALLGETGVDEIATASLKFPSGILAQLSTGTRLLQENAVHLYGTEGHLTIPNPWVPIRNGGVTSIFLKRSNASSPEEIRIESSEGLYSLEADEVARCISLGALESPAMSWRDSLGNMKLLDDWRAKVGLVYESEKPTALMNPLPPRTIRVHSKTPMKYTTLEGISQPISRLIMGCDNQPTLRHASVMFDDFLDRGGNAFDTAYIYASGRTEKLLGAWMKQRGLRQELVLLVKGCHTPACDPLNLTDQLLTSLQRLQTDYADLYLLHRDNPMIPAGEFIDILNEHQKKGLIRRFGVSNWTIPRIEEANAYARQKGLLGIEMVSNNFSLARMNDPIWEGCVAFSDPDSRAWLQKNQMPVLAWSSQARGFFTDLGAPERKNDPEMVRCWQSPENFKRRERAIELAQKKGCAPINIALAYVLHQSFPTLALIGPRTLEETRTSLPGLEVELTDDEANWLDLR